MKALLCLVLAPLLLTTAIRAEELSVQPGSELWRELFNPPYPKPTEIPRDNPLRKQLFDLLRPSIERVSKQRGIKFQGELKAFKNWALFSGTSLDANEKTIAFEPMGNSEMCALWLRTRDGWKLVDYATGISDVYWLIWIDQYGAPKNLLAPE